MNMLSISQKKISMFKDTLQSHITDFFGGCITFLEGGIGVTFQAGGYVFCILMVIILHNLLVLSMPAPFPFHRD